MAMFLAVRLRAGPEWDPSKPLEAQSGWEEHAAFMDALVHDGFVILGGPLADEHRVVLALDSESEEAALARLAEDPWHLTHLVPGAIDRWTIRLEGLCARSESPSGDSDRAAEQRT
jgi:hypothetical protein